MDLIYWLVRSSSRRGGGKGVIVNLACNEHHFIRVHENLVQHPRNNTSFDKAEIFKNIAEGSLISCHKKIKKDNMR